MRLRRLLALGAAGVAVVATVTAPAPTPAAPAADNGKRAKVVQKPYEKVERGVGAGERFRIYDPSAGESEQWYINDHTFVQGPDGTWHMFGITHEEPANPLDETYFAHATADSLTQEQWVKQDPVMHADVDSGETHVWAPYVMEHDGTYYMFYAGGTDDHENYRMQLATSKDLYHWDRDPDNPLFTDGYDARDPMVLRVGDRWVMYYTANSRPDGGNHIVAYRTSTDLRNWSERGVALKHPVQGTFGGPTESPYVVQDGDDYYLTMCCTANYTDTRVLHSKDPLHFEVDDEVGQIGEHASEVVRDGDDLYVSGAGWGQGGLFLRPLDLDQELVTTGRIVKTKRYRLDLQTSPHASIRSMDVKASNGWRRVLDDDFRSTAPYLAVGNFGSTDPAGEPRRIVESANSRRLGLRGVRLGDEPARVDWKFRFAPSHFDMSADWHINGKLRAPVWEVAMPIDTALPRVGDDEDVDRDTGDVPGFPRFALASSKQATVAAAYLHDSAWRRDNRYVDLAGKGFVWQAFWKAGGGQLARTTYPGGTWRIGANAKAHDRTLGERLYESLNAGRRR
ncbi:glycoside hydrolase [Nocardioidaceae bacterium SCSIO 66511]|nr:glycoside hydrolase [Nocardioidaceae bacterium SCSIO 66511]